MSALARRLRNTALPLVTLAVLAGCTLFSQTPSPDVQHQVRAAISYGMSAETADSKLSGLGFACSKRQGNYLDEGGHTRSAEHFLFCERRPGKISFSCENRDQVTAVLRNGVVAAIEVTRGPSCIKP